MSTIKICTHCEATKAILQDWLDKQGHERCWYYPDLFEALAKLHGVTMKESPSLPARAEFEAGCKKYQEEEFGKSV